METATETFEKIAQIKQLAQEIVANEGYLDVWWVECKGNKKALLLAALIVWYMSQKDVDRQF